MVEGDARVQSALDLLLARVDWATLKGENVDFWRLKNINIYIYIYFYRTFYFNSPRCSPTVSVSITTIILVTSWSAFWYSNQDTKIKTLVRPVLLYGCETWKITKNDERKLNSFQYQCLRRILRIRWQQRMTNKRVVETAEINEISREVRRRRRKG